jgi:hypothetical protein
MEWFYLEKNNPIQYTRLLLIPNLIKKTKKHYSVSIFEDQLKKYRQIEKKAVGTELSLPAGFKP